MFILNADRLKSAKRDLCVLHPLPRVGEIAYEVDGDPRAKYFKQAIYGMFVRMALIIRVLENNCPGTLLRGTAYGVKCPNPNCVTGKEVYLPESFMDRGEKLECEYCEGTVGKHAVSPPLV
jgi:aspartate carbamoyltransferase catalytic subunit